MNATDSPALPTDASDSSAEAYEMGQSSTATADAAGDGSGAEAEAGQIFTRPCPGEGGLTPLPACDLSNQNQVCFGFESYSVCIDGQWLACSNLGPYSSECPGDGATPPQGSRCCPTWYHPPSQDIFNDPMATTSCCSGGLQATCDHHRLTYAGSCTPLDAGLDGGD